jgi:CMP/dCMP kinase
MAKLICIDGPVKSGKGKIASLLAEKLGLRHFDTGNYYRAVTAIVCETGKDEVEVAEGLRAEDLMRSDLRDLEVDQRIPSIACNPLVRAAINNHIRQDIAAMPGGVIIDGRSGATEFPEAEVKIFLTASPPVRAQRWVDDLAAKGQPASTFSAMLSRLLARDEKDMSREVSPLMRNPGPEHYTDLIDSTHHHSVDETLDLALQVCSSALVQA